jgi:hypothetical protein
MANVLSCLGAIRTGEAESYYIRLQYEDEDHIAASVIDVLRDNGLRVEPYEINSAEGTRTVKIWIPGMETMFDELGNVPKKGTTWN